MGCPPPNRRGKTSWNLALTASKVSRKRLREARLIFSMAVSSWPMADSRSAPLRGQEVERFCSSSDSSMAVRLISPMRSMRPRSSVARVLLVALTSGRR